LVVLLTKPSMFGKFVVHSQILNKQENIGG
jgi:hypothetical protein